MRRLAAIAAFTTLLLSVACDAIAAADWAPRLERMTRCSWDRPGHNPFMGDVVAAIDRYSDIPTPVRRRLKQRMQARQYDDLVDIRRDEINGRERYDPVIRDMHFGLDRVCRQVTRERWSPQMHERGLVYCEQGHCILVPTVCRNVSRIERRPARLAGPTIGGPGDAPLSIDTPSAGPAPGHSDALAAPTVISSFIEPVASTIVAPWPDAGDPGIASGTGIEPADARLPEFGPWSSWPAFAGGTGSGPAGTGSSRETHGRIDVPLGDGVGFPDGTGDIGLRNDAKNGTEGGPAGDPPATVPEPSTGASLLLGLWALALVSARQRSRQRAAQH